MIEWHRIDDIVPSCDREIIVKNPDKLIKSGSGIKRHAVRKFRLGFSDRNIVGILLDDGYTLWSYL